MSAWAKFIAGDGAVRWAVIEHPLSVFRFTLPLSRYAVFDPMGADDLIPSTIEFKTRDYEREPAWHARQMDGSPALAYHVYREVVR